MASRTVKTVLSHRIIHNKNVEIAYSNQRIKGLLDYNSPLFFQGQIFFAAEHLYGILVTNNF